MGDDGLVLDEITGSSQMIEPGVSLTRVDVFADNRSELNLYHIRDSARNRPRVLSQWSSV